MRLHYAMEIASWRYSGFMKEIYMKPYFDHYNDLTGEMKGPLQCDGFAVFNGNELCGLFEYYIKDGAIEIGLALAPSYIGKGFSKDFILSGIEFGVNLYDYHKDYILLSVDHRNIAAYKSYLKAGFVEYDRNDEEIFMKYIIMK